MLRVTILEVTEIIHRWCLSCRNNCVHVYVGTQDGLIVFTSECVLTFTQKELPTTCKVKIINQLSFVLPP